MNNKFFFPDPEILEAIEDSYLLFQLLNQNALEKFEEYVKTLRYKGSIGEFSKILAFKNISEHQGKPWEHIVKTKLLLENNLNKIDANLFINVPDDYLTELSTIIKKGAIGLNKIKEWIQSEPDEILTAMYDACKVSMGSGEKYKKLDILEIADIQTAENTKISLYNEIFEIKSPEEIISTLKSFKEPVKNGLILTLLRNKKRFYKSTFYLFLAFDNKLYSISNYDYRLNLDNTAGDRNPDRYLEDHYKNTWLPVFLLFDSNATPTKEGIDIVPNTTSISLYNNESDRIISTWEDVVKYSPGCYYWMNMLAVRIFDAISSMEILKGMTPNDALKLLQTANDKNDLTFETPYKQGSGTYLIDIFTPQISAITINEESLHPVISPQYHIEKLISYQRRQKLASEIKTKLNTDYENNHENVYESIRALIKEKDIDDIIIKALRDEEYSCTVYRKFGFREEESSTMTGNIMAICEDIYEVIEENRPNQLLVPHDPFAINYDRYNSKCASCQKVQRKLFIRLRFHEWTQIVSFFDIPKEKFPPEMINHLHQQNEMYVGNSILDDLDPIDNLHDPWFRSATRHGASFTVWIPICKRCYNKFLKESQNPI